MKNLFTILLLFLSISLFGQTYNLKTQGNYFTITTIATGETANYPKESVRVEDYSDNVYFFFRGSSTKYGVTFDDVTYESGSTFSSKDELLDWAYSNISVATPNSYVKEAVLGNIPGEGSVNKFGINTDIDTAAEEILAEFGGAFDPTTGVITTAQTFTITYNNTTDGLGTTGATQLLFTYLDENYNEVVGVHVLGNTGSDVTSFTGFGINRCLVLANGGLGWNANTITITATIDATSQASIGAELSVTQQCLYHSPIGKKMTLDFIRFNCLKLAGGSAPKVTLKMYSYSRVTGTRYLFFADDVDTSVQNNVEIPLPIPYLIQGREVIYMTISTDTNNTTARGGFAGIIK